MSPSGFTPWFLEGCARSHWLSAPGSRCGIRGRSVGGGLRGPSDDGDLFDRQFVKRFGALHYLGLINALHGDDDEVGADSGEVKTLLAGRVLQLLGHYERIALGLDRDPLGPVIATETSLILEVGPADPGHLCGLGEGQPNFDLLLSFRKLVVVHLKRTGVTVDQIRAGEITSQSFRYA